MAKEIKLLELNPVNELERNMPLTLQKCMNELMKFARSWQHVYVSQDYVQIGDEDDFNQSYLIIMIGTNYRLQSFENYRDILNIELANRFGKRWTLEDTTTNNMFMTSVFMNMKLQGE